jgi:phosphoglycolate phosphatase
MSPDGFRLIVFDLDGTLIDSRRDLADAANAVLASCGGGPLAERDIGRMVGDGAATLLARVFKASGLERPPDALERFLAVYDRRLLNHTHPYPGIANVLGVLAMRATLAVLTNKPLASARRILEGLDLARYFAEDAVIGGDGPFPRKPDPAGLRHLSASANVPVDSTLFVGDSVIDWRTARAASTSVCLARYGFGYEGFPVAEIGPTDHLIDTPADLLAL